MSSKELWSEFVDCVQLAQDRILSVLITVMNLRFPQKAVIFDQVSYYHLLKDSDTWSKLRLKIMEN
jgi:hypothetical protein